MPSPFKHIAQIESLADFMKLTKQVVGKIGEDPVKVHYFPAFAFDKKEAPLLLFGDIPTPVLVSVKKAAGSTPLIGQCSANNADQLVFEGAVKPAMARKGLQMLGISRVIAAPDEENEGTEEQTTESEKPVAAKTVPDIVPKAVPKPPGSAPSSVLPITARKDSPQKVPLAPPKPSAGNDVGKKPAPAPKVPSEKEIFTERLRALLPLFQKASDTVGAPETELKLLFKTAGDLAKSKDFKAATTKLKALEDLVAATLSQVKAPSDEDAKDEDEAAEEDKDKEEALIGKCAKIQKAWAAATQDAAAAIMVLQAAILKTGDPRATGLASGFNRVLQKLPNLDPTMKSLSLAAKKGNGEAIAKHKTEALRLAKLCVAYLAGDRLVALAVKNPFVSVKLTAPFKTALQTLSAELK